MTRGKKLEGQVVRLRDLQNEWVTAGRRTRISDLQYDLLIFKPTYPTREGPADAVPDHPKLF